MRDHRHRIFVSTTYRYETCASWWPIRSMSRPLIRLRQNSDHDRDSMIPTCASRRMGARVPERCYCWARGYALVRSPMPLSRSTRRHRCQVETGISLCRHSSTSVCHIRQYQPYQNSSPLDWSCASQEPSLQSSVSCNTDRRRIIRTCCYTQVVVRAQSAQGHSEARGRHLL